METTETKENVGLEGQLVAEIQKSENEKIRITRNKFRGCYYIDMRLFFETKEGAWAPTRKGFSIKEDLFPAFVEGIRNAEALLKN